MKSIVNKKHAFLFQGVGTEYQKILHLLDEEQKNALSRYCSIVSEEIDMDLWDYLFNNSVTKYDKLFCDWIAIYTIDNIVFNTYTNLNLKPSVFLGYSMGLITAMTCGKSISFESGLHMLLSIYNYPYEASRENEAMGAIIGLTSDDVNKIVCSNNLENSVGIASVNNEYCIVISGDKDKVEKVRNIAEMEGAFKTKHVNSPFAFHYKHAKKGIESFAKVVDKTNVSNCQVPIISSFDQKLLQDSAVLKKELVKNMYSKMLWNKSIEKAYEMGIDNFVEVSMEDSISKFSKIINDKCEFNTYKKIKLKLHAPENHQFTKASIKAEN